MVMGVVVWVIGFATGAASASIGKLARKRRRLERVVGEPTLGSALREVVSVAVGERDVTSRASQLPRHRVLRKHGGKTFQAYAGDDGSKAMEAWEAYLASDLPGLFVFQDRQSPSGNRGMFTREATPDADKPNGRPPLART